MSVRNAQQGVATKLLHSAPLPVSQLPAWVRNPSWPAIPVVNSTDQKFVGLYAVYPNTGSSLNSFISLSAAGAYTVSFGDGSAAQNIATGVQVNYVYDYTAASLVGTEAPVTWAAVTGLISRSAHGYVNGMTVRLYSPSTSDVVEALPYYVVNAATDTFQISATQGGSPLNFTADGTANLLPYRVALVTVTPQAGNLTTLNIGTKHNQVGLQNNYNVGWLDIALAGSITALTISGNTTRDALLERANIVSCLATNFTSLFANCPALRSVSIGSTGTLTATMQMFMNCYSLQSVPLFNTASVSNMNGMFQGCYQLLSVPFFNTQSATNMGSMFNSCYLLQSMPLFNTALATTMSSMLQNCYALRSVPLFNTAAVTNMLSMFAGCGSLQTVPLFNTALVTNMSGMFTGCAALQSVPLFNTALVTTMSSMFSGCASLQTVPLFNTAAVKDMSSMFYNCYSLITVPLFNTAQVTNMQGMFWDCYSLQSVPPFVTSLVTTMQYMFWQCYALQTVPLFDTSKVTNMNTMFSTCYSLAAVPLFNTQAVTDMGSMFSSCNALVSVPLFNTAQVTNMNSMFSSCPSLLYVPPFNTQSVTNMGTMFSSCTVLATVPAMNAGNVTSANLANIFNACPSLSSILMYGFKFSFTVANCKLSSAALNTLYGNLGTGVTGQTLTVSGNWGTANDNIALAPAGWTVAGS